MSGIAAIYPRVSSKGQEDGYSLDTQEAAMRRLAGEHGYATEEAHIYREVHTGSELWERPQLTRLRDAVRAGEVVAVVVYSLDRLARRLVHQEILLEEFQRFGVAVLVVDEPLDDSPEGQLMRAVKGYGSEKEREKIKERTMRGKLAKMQNGRLPATNRPLYGYRWADESKSRYAIVEESAEIVRQIFDLAAGGYPLRRIASDLTTLGIPTPNGGPRWVHTVIRAMLVHEGYKGEAFANRTMIIREKGRSKQVPRPVEEWVKLPEGTIPPIVSAEVWAAVQGQLKKNKAEAPRNNRSPESFLLRSGFVFCPCGAGAYASWEPRGNKPERVPGYRIRPDSNAHYGCAGTTIAAGLLDAAIWRWVVGLVSKPEIIEAELQRRESEDRTAGDLAAIDRALGEVKRKQANLSRALSLIDDAEAAAPLVAEIKVLGERKRSLDAEREGVLARRESAQASRDTLATIQTWALAVKSRLHDLSYAEKRDLLSVLNVRVVLHPRGHSPRWEVTADLGGVCVVDNRS